MEIVAQGNVHVKSCPDETEDPDPSGECICIEEYFDAELCNPGDCDVYNDAISCDGDNICEWDGSEEIRRFI